MINEKQRKYALIKAWGEIVRDTADCITFDQPENVTPVDELNSTVQKVVVFDDIRLDKTNMNRIKEYFSLSRNKNCNCIYLVQSYYDVPKFVR